jgi:hypothetical protein
MAFLAFWPTVCVRTATRKRKLGHRHVVVTNNNKHQHVLVTEGRQSSLDGEGVKFAGDSVQGPGQMTGREEGVLRKGKLKRSWLNGHFRLLQL